MKKQTETRMIDGIEYRVLLRRVPEEGKSNVRNRRETRKNGLNENTTKQKKANVIKKESAKANNGTTPTRTKKVRKL